MHLYLKKIYEFISIRNFKMVKWGLGGTHFHKLLIL